MHSFVPAQRTISRSRPSLVLVTRNGSARWARTIATMSAAPSAITRSAVAKSSTRPATNTLARSPTTALARLA